MSFKRVRHGFRRRQFHPLRQTALLQLSYNPVDNRLELLRRPEPSPLLPDIKGTIDADAIEPVFNGQVRNLNAVGFVLVG